MKVKLLSPFEDGEPIWIGLDTPGMRRKVSRLVSPSIGSEEFMGGVTIFEPGESSSMHVHDESEEINIVLGGRGTLVSEGEEREFETHEWMWIPRGIYHQHKNTGKEPLRLAWILYAPGRPPVLVTDAHLAAPARRGAAWHPPDEARKPT